jgi:PKD repeat protein
MNRGLALKAIVLVGFLFSIACQIVWAEEPVALYPKAWTWIEFDPTASTVQERWLPTLYRPEPAAAPLVIDGRDFPIINSSSTAQSENSIFINPLDPWTVLNSNNSMSWPSGARYGADAFVTHDGGQTWIGSTGGAGGANKGDPSTAIDLSGRMYVGYITSAFGMGISYSADGGATWIQRAVATKDSLDKEHLWVDNGPLSPYSNVFHCQGAPGGSGILYDAWTNFSSRDPNYHDIEFARSLDGGDTWSAPRNLSNGIEAPGGGGFNQGVNIHTGPQGQAYVIWAIYDYWEPTNGAPEGGIGFAKSLDGGVTWTAPTRIQYITGIRRVGTLGGNKTMRTNSFPSMAVDQQTGRIYVVWTNWNVSNNEIDVYMISSADQGNTWSARTRVNQDVFNNGKDQWSPWIACDPITGDVSCIFYDSRNFPNNDGAETYAAFSQDHGVTWSDFKVSDYSWSGDAIPGFAGYAGDYLSIAARDGRVYPVWSDSHTGNMLAYTSPFTLSPTWTDPVADFTASPTSGCPGVAVSFTNLSTGPIATWSWNFGDLGTSAEQNPVHTYAAPGIYTVTLTVSGSNGSGTKMRTDYITVTNPPTAGFVGAPTSGSVPLTVLFSDQSSGATRWSWNFGDGGTSALRNPAHTYTMPGVFAVSLTATNGCTSNTSTRTGYITVGGTAPVWPSDGVPLSSGPGSADVPPAAISDGAGGVLVAWQDSRGANQDIFVQHANAYGNVTWTAGGVLVCGAPGDQTDPHVTTDGHGGLIVTWVDNRTGEPNIYAQRVDANGIPRWAANGVPVCADPSTQYEPAIASDGDDGAMIAWEDHREGASAIFAQRLDTNGTRQWTEGAGFDGIKVCPVPAGENSPEMVSEPDGSAVVTWLDQRSGVFVYGIFAQRIRTADADPTLMERMWNPDGIEVISQFAILGYDNAQTASDGSGGVVVAWVDRTGATPDVRAQHICDEGSKTWGLSGILVGGGVGDQLSPVVIAGVEGNAFFSWQDNRTGSYDIRAQQVDANGTAEWGVDGVVPGGAAGDQLGPQMTSDGAGGIVVAWQDRRGGTGQDVYARRVTAIGSLIGQTNGDRVSSGGANVGTIAMVQSGAGEAIVSYLNAQSGTALVTANRTKPQTVVDLAPIVTAPDTTWVTESKSLVLQVSASDPNGDPIDVLTASPLPSGAGFSTNPAHTSGTLTWTPLFTQAGDYSITFTASNALTGTKSSMLRVREGERLFTVGANTSIRLTSGGNQWCVQLEAVDFSFDPFNVIPQTVVLASPGTGSVPQITWTGKTAILGDMDGNGLQDLQLCFSKNDLRRLFSNLTGVTTVTLTLTADLTTGAHLRRQMTIQVYAGGQAAAVISPGSQPAVRFTTAVAGPLRVRLFDVAGRLVGTLLDQNWAEAGNYDIPVDGLRMKGSSLRSGIYFYRVDDAEGESVGRVLILR